MDLNQPVILIICPRCEQATSAPEQVCTECGFPMSCDIAPLPNPVATVPLGWRLLLGIGALVFWLTNAVFIRGGYYEYLGYTTNVLETLAPSTDSGIEISGPLDFEYRTQMVLGLLEERSPSYYFRVRQYVSSIDYLAPNYLESSSGKRISLEDIGALASPDTGAVQVLYSTAFPRGVAEFMDYDLFSYAGILIHEMRHIELHSLGQDPGGWLEEKLCEESAADCLQFMGAPGGVMAKYHSYLADPTAKRYQKWYDWYNQWD